jgi:hypothetical protein
MFPFQKSGLAVHSPQLQTNNEELEMQEIVPIDVLFVNHPQLQPPMHHDDLSMFQSPSPVPSQRRQGITPELTAHLFILIYSIWYSKTNWFQNLQLR